MAVAAENPWLGKRTYLQVGRLLDPGNGSNAWPDAQSIPGASDLPHQGDMFEALRWETVTFLSAAGLPVSPEPPEAPEPPEGISASAVVGVSLGDLAKLAGWLMEAIRFLVRLRRGVSSARRRRHLAEYCLTIRTNHAEGTATPTLAVLPDLVAHLGQKFPTFRVRVRLDARHVTPGHLVLEAAPGKVSDASILKVLKLCRHGCRYIGLRPRALPLSGTKVRAFDDGILLWEFTHPGKTIVQSPPG